MTMKKDVLLKALSEQVIEVVFTKKDGSIRSMNCTRNMGLIPNEYHPKNSEDSTSLESAENIKVFDVDKQGWRSFNFSSIMQG